MDDGTGAQISGFTLAHERIEVEDTAVACLRFANGALGVIQATTSVHPGLPKTIAVHGDRGTAVIEQEDVLPGTSHRKRPRTGRQEQLPRRRSIRRLQQSGGDLARLPCPPARPRPGHLSLIRKREEPSS